MLMHWQKLAEQLRNGTTYGDIGVESINFLVSFAMIWQ
jgi:hypothetical protein